MPSISNFYPSKWLTAADLPEEGLVLTIGDVGLEKMIDGQEKPIINFVEHEKGLVCNKTNAKTIANLYGDETDDWQGHKICLYPTEVDFKGERKDAIRVKNKKPKEVKANGKSKKPAEPITQAELDAIDDEDDAVPY